MLLKEREYGLDILRILSMGGIIGLHVLTQGGVIWNVDVKTIEGLIMSILYSICSCSVNVFAMITGYIYCDKQKISYSRLIELWIIVYFYLILIFVVFLILKPEIISTSEVIIKAIFPPVAGRLWYITCYSFLFLFIPYINKFINSLTNREYREFVLIGFLLLCVGSTVGIVDFWKIERGYSPFWLIYCYLTGGYIKKYYIENNYNMCKIKIFLGINFLFSALWFLGMGIITPMLKHDGTTSDTIMYMFYNYNSPTMYINAILLLYMFLQKKYKKEGAKRVILSLSNATFSVYIVHCTPLIIDNIITNRFQWIIEKKFFSGMYVLVSIFVIFCTAYLMDMGRKRFFNILHIEKGINKICCNFQVILNYVQRKLL